MDRRNPMSVCASRCACLAFVVLPFFVSGASCTTPLLQQSPDESTHVSLRLPEIDLPDRPLPTKSPLWAMFASAIIPGGGQLYTENTLRGLAFFAAQTGVLTKLLLEHIETTDSWARYQHTNDHSAYLDYEHHFERRYDYLWWCGLIWGLSIADAYVDAHLYGFEENGIPSLSLTPTLSQPGLRISLAVSF